MRPFLFAVVLLVALVLVAAPATPQVPGNFGAGLPASPATDVDRTQTTLAPGVSLERFTRVTGPDRTRISVLRADLSLPTVSADLLFPGVVAERRQLTAMATSAGAIGGVNGDFFDIENDPSDSRLRSDAPAGTAIAGDELLKSFDPVSETEGRKTALLGADETGRVGDAGFAGTLALPGGPAPLDGFNRFRVLDGQVGAYTGRWGPYTRARVVEGASEVRSVLVRDGRVAEVRDGTRAGQIDAGSFELVGRGAGARRLSGLEPGTTVGASAARRSEGSRALLSSPLAVWPISYVAGRSPTMAHPLTSTAAAHTLGSPSGSAAGARSCWLSPTGARPRARASYARSTSLSSSRISAPRRRCTSTAAARRRWWPASPPVTEWKS